MGDESFKSLIQQYQGGYCFGLLEVDRVQNADQPDWMGRTAPWVRKLRLYGAQELAGYKLYCSDRSANFNQVKVQETYPPHLFIWRTGEKAYIRAISGEDMKAIIAEKLSKKGDGAKDMEEVAVNVATLPPQKTHGMDKISTDHLAPFAQFSQEDEVPPQLIANLMDDLKAAIGLMRAAMDHENGEVTADAQQK